jgi:hypothetical protein
LKTTTFLPPVKGKLRSAPVVGQCTIANMDPTERVVAMKRGGNFLLWVYVLQHRMCIYKNVKLCGIYCFTVTFAALVSLLRSSQKKPSMPPKL